MGRIAGKPSAPCAAVAQERVTGAGIEPGLLGISCVCRHGRRLSLLFPAVLAWKYSCTCMEDEKCLFRFVGRDWFCNRAGLATYLKGLQSIPRFRS